MDDEALADALALADLEEDTDFGTESEDSEDEESLKTKKKKFAKQMKSLEKRARKNMKQQKKKVSKRGKEKKSTSVSDVLRRMIPLEGEEINSTERLKRCLSRRPAGYSIDLDLPNGEHYHREAAMSKKPAAVSSDYTRMEDDKEGEGLEM